MDEGRRAGMIIRVDGDVYDAIRRVITPEYPNMNNALRKLLGFGPTGSPPRRKPGKQTRSRNTPLKVFARN